MARASMLLIAPALLAVAACGSNPRTAGPPVKAVHHSCSGVAGTHHAFIVVQHGAGNTVDACAGFDGAKVSGFALMKDSGLELATQTTKYGPAVCQVDNEPPHYTQCLPANAPYWAFWIWNGTAWTVGQTGYADASFTDGQAIGWVYTPQTVASPAPPPPPPAS